MYINDTSAANQEFSHLTRFPHFLCAFASIFYFILFFFFIQKWGWSMREVYNKCISTWRQIKCRLITSFLRNEFFSHFTCFSFVSCPKMVVDLYTKYNKYYYCLLDCKSSVDSSLIHFCPPLFSCLSFIHSFLSFFLSHKTMASPYKIKRV